MEKLYASIKSRWRPEDVAEAILEARGADLLPQERRALEVAARGSLKRQVVAYTSMLQDFARPVGMARQVAKAMELFRTAPEMPLDRADDPAVVEAFVQHICPEVQKAFGRNSFKYDRLNREMRGAAGLDLSRRQYNKRFRLLTRMEAKLKTLVREWKKRTFQMVGKSGLASTLSWEEFAADADTACFVAYYTARANLRSEFTVSGQQRAFDQIAEMLLERCRRSATANWFAVAHVLPTQEVLARLTDEQKGTLLARWFGVLQEVGALLESLFNASEINRDTMIVRRGNDSTTWNNTTGAWNRARDNWIALLHALGMGEVLDSLCPGKALRLMAADVTVWHLSLGRGLPAENAVWAELPLPWEVLGGRAVCTRNTVLESCRRHGVDAEKSGWAGPKPPPGVVRFRATPELVHGVTVANPFLATVLKREGFFSGKPRRARAAKPPWSRHAS
ncbi:MAG TPA: hypothetical protein VM490_01370 [Armatimonadaceae bacterium]|nr:hypothetical protein [Armatimonadaceae bacterium]